MLIIVILFKNNIKIFIKYYNFIKKLLKLIDDELLNSKLLGI